MRSLVLITMFIFCFNVTILGSSVIDSEKEDLREEVKKLRSQISELNKTIAGQEKQIKKLLDLCRENNIPVNEEKEKVTDSQSIIISKEDFLNTDLRKTENSIARNLLMQDDIDSLNTKLKLKLLAMKNGSIDTKQHHKRLNRLDANHKFRVKVITCFDQYRYMDKKVAEGISKAQKYRLQKGLEALKVGDLDTFDFTEKITQEFFEGAFNDIYKLHLKTQKEAN